MAVSEIFEDKKIYQAEKPFSCPWVSGHLSTASARQTPLRSGVRWSAADANAGITKRVTAAKAPAIIEDDTTELMLVM